MSPRISAPADDRDQDQDQLAGSNAAVPRPYAPRSARGRRSRDRLVAAARTVFQRDGYLGARINDISAEAGTAAGSFYFYFSDKYEIFAAVLEELQDEMLHPHTQETVNADSPAGVIEASNRAYLRAYKRNAGLMRALEQGATSDERIRALRAARGEAFAQRNARSIRDLQERGLADSSLDPVLAARALASMVARMAYARYVLDEKASFENLVTTLTRLWCNALRVPID